jgi:alpha-beta hydrolase superfamily lysophospholipase
MQKTIVIGVHGAYCTSAIFEPIEKHLSSMGYLFVPATLPGHDSTTSHNMRRYTLREYSQHVGRVIKQKRAEFPKARIFLLGHSMGTSVINALFKDDAPEVQHVSGVIFLAPIVGTEHNTLMTLCWRYTHILLPILLGLSHKPSFPLIQKEMLNKTTHNDAERVYAQMVHESGKALRTAFLERGHAISHIPYISIFGSNDRTIPPRHTTTSVIVMGDHISMIAHAAHTIHTFIKEQTY